MEQRKCEDSRQIALDFKGEKILPGVEKLSALSPAPVQRPGIAGNQNLETKIASLTPEKTNEPLHAKFKEESVELLEKHKTIAEFFDRMNCSLRLLSLRKKSPTFQNISTQVEILTKRKFSYRHLAQIKYIFPEAVQIDKILIHDEKTLCMKPGMKIALLFDVIEGHHEQSDFVALCQAFASRLLNFFNTHPEGCDIPEAILPEPFNQRSHSTIPKALPKESSVESQPTSVEIELLSDASHLYASFSRYFSQKAIGAETEKTQLLASPVPLSSVRSDSVTNQNIKSGQLKESPDLCSKSIAIKSPVQLIPQCSVSSSAGESPLVKLDSVAGSLMVETPAQSTPKRSMLNCEDELKTITSQKLTSCYIPAKRSLDFSRLEGDESASIFTEDKSEQYKVVHDAISQTVEAEEIFVEEDVTSSPELLQKVEESNGCTVKDHETSQTGLVMHQQMSTFLPDLLALIHGIFQSVNCSSITKEELVHKIIMNNCDIVEKREVEEQLELLEKLVPDWICRKMAPSGDLLYNVRKVSDFNTVRARLNSM